jgi:bacterioferritin-associated ferredoxin
MYVCICNRIKEGTVRALAEEGLGFDEIQALTGCSSTCGSCQEFAEELIVSVQATSHQVKALNILAGNTV